VFCLDLPQHPAVERRLETYLSQEKRNIEKALARMVRYRRFVGSSLRERGLPPELLALPLLESRYLPRAVSRSGAAGLWQLMGNTSGGLGLRSDEWLDERRDFWLSTKAALRKLEDNYGQFGDWYLALAAYNCGSGFLARLIASTGVRDFWELRARGLLRTETAEFVPAFIALARIVGSPARYGLQGGWELSPDWERVRLQQSVDLRLLARALGLDPELLREANAELRYPVTPVYEQGYYLKLPAGLGQRVGALLSDPGSRLLEYRYHRLASGDTLYGLSRRYGVALALLERANAGLDPRRLAVGGIVRIPVIDGEAAGPAAAAVPAATTPAAAAPDFQGAWTVERGDTLWAIARRHGITPELLAAANGRSLDSVLKPGDTLKVPAVEAAEEP
jgi:membrane-bound lytic murein transglycosylase D